MAGRAYQFGSWLIEPELNRVTSGPITRHLAPLTMDILCHLLENAGDAVPSEALLETIWRGRVVESNAVPRAVNEIRRALDDSARAPCYIETIRKRGYRTIAPVVPIASSSGADTETVSAPKVERHIGFTQAEDGVRIAYATSGQGPPVVLVVGWFTHLQLGAVFDAADVVNPLSREHMLVRYDGRGFGMSDRDVDDFSLTARIRDLAAVIDAIDVECVSLLGASKGSEVAISYAAAHPDKVSKLIVAGGTLGIAWTGMKASEKDDLDRVLSLLRSQWESPAVRGILAGPAGQGSHVPFDDILELLRISGSGSAYADFLESLLDIDVSDSARRVEQPTLILAGQADQVHPVAYARDIATLIPHARITILDASHLDTACGQETISEVLRFLHDEESGG